MHLKRRLILGKLAFWLSFVVPVHFTTTFINHRGAPWRVWWWQWRRRTFRKGGVQLGPAGPALDSPCTCHDAAGNRTAAHHLGARED